MKMKVGINLEDFPLHWQGGVNYYKNLFSALALSDQDTVIALTGVSTSSEMQRAFPDLRVVGIPLLEKGHPLNLIRRIVRRILGTDWMLDHYLRIARIDILTHSNPLGPSARTPNIAWIPDFQHRHLPHLFSADELEIRDRQFRKICTESDAVFVSSAAAANDLVAFEPSAAFKCKVLRFCIQPINHQQLPTEAEIRSQYGIVGDYFYVPNQFWPHKNHATMLKAVALLKSRSFHLPQFIFSGSMEARGGERHVDEILQFVEAEQLQTHVKFLGTVPYSHVLGLARYSLAIVNPSLFEGWSTSVEEAKELCKFMLLSDLPVNIEQISEGAQFFDPNDPASIAEAIELFLSKGPSSDMTYARQNKISMSEFGQNFRSQLLDVIRCKRQTATP